jgi:hypothetical protein
VVEGPEDVGAAVHAEAGPQRALLVEHLHDRPLDVVEVGLDPASAQFIYS